MKDFKRWMESKGLDYRVWDQSTISNQLNTMNDYIDYTKGFGCGGVTAQEAMNNMDNAIGGWKDLDIYNLPERFFTRDDIEIEYLWDMGTLEASKRCCGRYDWIADTGDRLDIPEGIIKENDKYRYRIKKKKETINVVSVIMHPDGNIRCTKEDGGELILKIID